VTKTHVFETTYMYSQTVVTSVRDSTHTVQVNCILLHKDLLVPEDHAKVGNLYTHDRLYNICIHEGVWLQSKLQNTANWSATIWPPGSLCYRTALFFAAFISLRFHSRKEKSAYVLEMLLQFLIALQVPKSNCVIRRVSALRDIHL
jgi:hypothetical protein